MALALFPSENMLIKMSCFVCKNSLLPIYKYTIKSEFSAMNDPQPTDRLHVLFVIAHRQQHGREYLLGM